jgi:hypothetical protein
MLDTESKRCYNYENGETVMNFSVGADIEIQTKWKSNLLGVDFDYNTFKGKVVPNPKWLDKDYVSIRAIEQNKWFDYPINYIHKKYIVGHSFSEERSKARIFQVKSKASDKVYTVISEGGDVICDCVGFQFRRKCKHSEKVKSVL